jgi:hypothetical protein
MKYLDRESIKFQGMEYNISTTSLDWIAWNKAYDLGYRKPRYPLPAIPIEVEVFPDFIVVAEMNDPQYSFGALTLYPHD